MIRVSRICLAAALLIVPGGSVAFGAAPARPRQVLVLYSFSYGRPINLDWDRGIRLGLEANLHEPVDIDVEFLEVEQLPDREGRDKWVDLLRMKYADSAPDIVIPVADSAAACLAVDHPDLFPQAAVVFCSVSAQTLSRFPMTNRMTGVAYRFDFQGTLQIACRLFPATRSVIVVGGASPEDLAVQQVARAAYAQETQVQFTYWSGLPVAELCAKASQVPAGTVIVLLSHVRDRDGFTSVATTEIAQRIAEAAKVPVFGLYDTILGTGIVGGSLAPVKRQGERAGAIAARVIRGASPYAIPISGTEMNRPMFDWRLLRRWGIDEDDLPDDSLVLFREPTVWETYWAYITAAVTAIALQAILIGALLVSRRRRRRAERALADQLQFETMLSDVSSRFVGITPDAISAEIERALACVVEHLRLDRGALFRLSEDGRELIANVTSVRPGEVQPPAVIPLDSIPWMWAQLIRGDVFHVSATSDLPAEAFHERELADRLGVKAVAAVALQEGGQMCGLLTFGLRTHEQPWDTRILQRIRLISEVIGNALAHLGADEALAASRNETRQLAGRLLTAQEEERKRLAREMHDDVSQRLAANAIQVGQIEQQLPAADPARPALAVVQEQLSNLSQDVHRISRQLHPSILEDLGLADAVRSECQRWESQSQIAVDFRCGELPAGIPKDVALCLFRITQEALRNAARHSQTERIELVLTADAECIRLKVQDYGCGFDPARTRGRPGLGLASMQERARFVGGDIQIESAPGQGTAIVVSLPLPEDV